MKYGSFEEAERATERATRWQDYKKPDGKKTLTGVVEGLKLLMPGEVRNIERPVYVIEIRDYRDGILYSKFVSEQGLMAKVFGLPFETDIGKLDVAKLDPATFPIQKGKGASLRYLGEHDNDYGGKTTRWDGVPIELEEEPSAAEADDEPEEGTLRAVPDPADAEDGIPF